MRTSGFYSVRKLAMLFRFIRQHHLAAVTSLIGRHLEKRLLPKPVQTCFAAILFSNLGNIRWNFHINWCHHYRRDFDLSPILSNQPSGTWKIIKIIFFLPPKYPKIFKQIGLCGILLLEFLAVFHLAGRNRQIFRLQLVDAGRFSRSEEHTSELQSP